MVPLYVVFLNGDYMVIMSVDYGDVRTGVAVCDKKEILFTVTYIHLHY